MTSVTSLLDTIQSLSLKLEQEDDVKVRNEAVQLSRQLTAMLSRPEDVAAEMIFTPFIPIAVKIAIEMNVIEHIVKATGPITSDELAKLTNAEELLISRVLRVIASVGLVANVGDRTWQATPVTKAMAFEGVSAGYRMIEEMVMGAAVKAPKYLRETGYRCPTNPSDGFMQYAFQTKLSSFELFHSIPWVMENFNKFMGSSMGARQIWTDWYPMQEQLIDGFDPETPLLVDIGGGWGHDILAFHTKYPNKGKLILQDLPDVVKDKQEFPDGVEAMGYDFFTEQPVKGARAYFYHHILHDWSDYKCEEILQQVKNAMKPGYSKLYIHEMIVPDAQASAYVAMLDMTMMCFNAGMERTTRQWEELLARVGLEVVKVWTAPEDGAGGIVEAMVKE
ncbi:sterigmatocystin 8-O-methyltransferase [Xylaria bambusicola]|uniref:sterigmatocystin 8-O-methyltransferase n=1 Tax=Xylaria bambusicola TaxID=326684 RepID=UPI00200749EC|nr:sterigmatocystin 8-O-methyltransferase [Xylaria bambusicola]KAI0505343.1 sterigmatocystin 8-O-methyltransferase [Xylaria bambusicola]